MKINEMMLHELRNETNLKHNLAKRLIQERRNLGQLTLSARGEEISKIAAARSNIMPS